MTTTTNGVTTYIDKGCWRDSEDRTLSIMTDGGDRKHTTVDTCAAIASKNFLTTFALQDGNRYGKGQCFLAKGSDDYTRQGAVPSPCAPLGDGYLNHVYTIPAQQAPSVKDLGCWSTTSSLPAMLPLITEEKNYYTPEACAKYVNDKFPLPWWSFGSGRTFTVRDGTCYVSDKDNMNLSNGGTNGNTAVTCAANGAREKDGVYHMYQQPSFWESMWKH